MFERAADGGNARGATEAGMTYDPNVRTGASSVTADPARAAAWYRKGAALGDGRAADLLQRLAGRG
jgi:TPR repeat protein